MCTFSVLAKLHLYVEWWAYSFSAVYPMHVHVHVHVYTMYIYMYMYLILSQ